MKYYATNSIRADWSFIEGFVYKIHTYHKTHYHARTETQVNKKYDRLTEDRLFAHCHSALTKYKCAYDG